MYIYYSPQMVVNKTLMCCRWPPKNLLPSRGFTEISNGGAWPAQGLSFFIGLIGSVFAMFGKLLSGSNGPRKRK